MSQPPFNADILATDAPPVMEARRWLDGVTFPPERPLINVSQAAPVATPPEGLRKAIADAAMSEPEAHLYGPVLGRDDLRAEVANQWADAYHGSITADQVAITSGCNQAFAAVLSTLAAKGDEVIIPTPWYFNHKMWCDMQGIRAVPLPAGDGLCPDPEQAETLITPKTRAIALVSPNNPGGVEYPPALIRRFLELCRKNGIALILDETYRDFHSAEGALHDLFSDPDWSDTLIHLYSFSKAFRLTGHRVGAVIAHATRLAEAEKFLDTVAICPNQLGQIAALWGLRNLGDWVKGERAEILARRDAMRTAIEALPGWGVLGCGAYFAYVTHPFDAPSDKIAQQLVQKAGILLLPGTMFRPTDDPSGAGELRIAFANTDVAGISDMAARLAAL